jgi:hypothetical protein
MRQCDPRYISTLLVSVVYAGVVGFTPAVTGGILSSKNRYVMTQLFCQIDKL